MDHGYGEKGVEAGGETLPAHDHAAVLPLQPGKRPLGLVARGFPFHWPPPRAAALPHPLGDLGPDPASAEALTEVFRIIPLIHLRPYATPSPPPYQGEKEASTPPYCH